MKCPNCGKALWFVKEICPFCKIALAPTSDIPGSESHIDLVAEEKTHENPAWVTVKKCGTITDADAVCTQLEAAGIKCFIPDENVMQTLPLHVSTYGLIRVQVPAADVSRASELLRSIEADLAMHAVEEMPPSEVRLSMFKALIAFTLPIMCCPGWLIFAVILNNYASRGCIHKKEGVGSLVRRRIRFLVYRLHY